MSYKRKKYRTAIHLVENFAVPKSNLLSTSSLKSIETSLLQEPNTMTPKTYTKKIMLSRVQAFDVIQKLKESYDQEKGSYHEGISDSTLASSMPFQCSPLSVGGIRKELFGNFKFQAPRGASNERLAKMEAFLAAKFGYMP